jgi:hypothetical protein
VLLAAGIGTAFTLDKWVGHEFPTLTVLAIFGSFISYIYRYGFVLWGFWGEISGFGCECRVLGKLWACCGSDLWLATSFALDNLAGHQSPILTVPELCGSFISYIHRYGDELRAQKVDGSAMP